MASSTREYFLSFDAATKTLAFALLSLDRAGVGPLRERLEYLKGLRARLQSAAPGPDFDAALEMLDAAAEELAEDSRALVRLHAGDVSDLFPDRADKSISEQERIKAVRDYVDALVRPALESIGGAPVRVFIEFQMSRNFKSRSVATALATLLIEHPVVFVMPMLKNRVFFAPELHYGLIAKKYKTTYAANKRHAVLNTQLLAERFGIELKTRKGLLSHISDAIMQVFGQLRFGDGQLVAASRDPQSATRRPATRRPAARRTGSPGAGQLVASVATRRPAARRTGSPGAGSRPGGPLARARTPAAAKARSKARAEDPPAPSPSRQSSKAPPKKGPPRAGRQKLGPTDLHSLLRA